jgi:hypothetical protein
VFILEHICSVYISLGKPKGGKGLFKECNFQYFRFAIRGPRDVSYSKTVSLTLQLIGGKVCRRNEM